MEPILKLLAEAKFNGLKDIQHGQLEDFLILNGGAVTSPRGKIHLCACFTLNGINLSSGVSALTHDRLSIQIRISYISQEALQRCLQSVCKPVAPGRKVGVGQIEKKSVITQPSDGSLQCQREHELSTCSHAVKQLSNTSQLVHHILICWGYQRCGCLYFCLSPWIWPCISFWFGFTQSIYSPCRQTFWAACPSSISVCNLCNPPIELDLQVEL